MKRMPDVVVGPIAEGAYGGMNLSASSALSAVKGLGCSDKKTPSRTSGLELFPTPDSCRLMPNIK